MSLNVIVLAAGQGKRMHSDLPKVLHTLAGRSLLGRVVDTARALEASKIVIVHGHGGEQVRRAFAGDTGLAWAEQKAQLGTGHAVMQSFCFSSICSDSPQRYAQHPALQETSPS